MVGSPHGFIIHSIVISKNIKKVTEVIDVKNWRKLVSQLAVLGVFFSQEDLNLKFLRSLRSKWNTHVVVLRNKSDLDTMSLDDLYNNFKIVKQEKIIINGSDTAGYDKSKVECFNCHKMGILQDNAECQGTKRTEPGIKKPQEGQDIKIKDSQLVVLKCKLEKISNEKDALETKIEKFENASQSLDKLIGSQVTNNSKKGLGYVSYNVVPPPHTGSVKISAPVKENKGATLIEDCESDEEDEVEVESPPEKERKTIAPCNTPKIVAAE
nr:ribonuclease H-like domain-containing protein [Tanacetum cinerariifolium]